MSEMEIEGTVQAPAEVQAEAPAVSTPAEEAPAVPEAAPVGDSLMNTLSEDLRAEKSLQSFKDVNGLAKSYLHLNGLLGKKFVDLSPEELDGYYTKIGRPESSEGYKILEDYPTNEAVAWYKDLAFKNGLTQAQAKAVADAYVEIEQQNVAALQQQEEQQSAQWIEEVKTEFGSAFEQRINVAKKAVAQFGGNELRDYLNQSGLGNHPAMVRAFAEIGKQMLEDTIPQSQSDTTFGITPQDALQKINNLKRDKDFMGAYRSATAPGHSDAVAELKDLYKIAYPQE